MPRIAPWFFPLFWGFFRTCSKMVIFGPFFDRFLRVRNICDLNIVRKCGVFEKTAKKWSKSVKTSKNGQKVTFWGSTVKCAFGVLFCRSRNSGFLNKNDPFLTFLKKGEKREKRDFLGFCIREKCGFFQKTRFLRFCHF